MESGNKGPLMKFIEFLSDAEGVLSSKRLITFMAFVCMVLGFMFNLFMGLDVEEFMFDAMMYIVVCGLGFTLAERYSSKK